MNKKILPGLTIIGAACALIFSLTFANTPPPSPVPETQSLATTITANPTVLVKCQGSSLTDRDRQRCIEAGGIIELKATDDARLWATTRARPTTAPMSGLATSAALVAARGTLTPTPTLPPDGIHPEDKRIERVIPEGGGGSLLSYRYFTSIWRVGAVLSEDRTGYAYYLMTPKDACGLRATTVGPDFSGLPAYERSWECPDHIGEIQITDVTSQTGLVTFTNYTRPPYVANRQPDVRYTPPLTWTGTFNLATEEWTSEGHPWQPQATATPQPVVPAQPAFNVYMPLTRRFAQRPTPKPTTEPPMAPADTFYVDETYDDDVEFLGVTRLRAYRIGYLADVGAPRFIDDEFTSRIILAFGRQIDDFVDDRGNQVWGVDLPFASEGRHSNEWVKEVTEAFIAGYNAGHNQVSIIAIGTSNYTPGWNCESGLLEGRDPVVSEKYREAGIIWADLLEEIQRGPYVARRGAIDIESWDDPATAPNTDEEREFIACGLGALEWQNGYISRTTLPLINFGSNAYGERNDQWTELDMFLLNDRADTISLPQVYRDIPIYTTRWTEILQQFPFQFDGVTSTNSTGGLGWQESWIVFDDALAQNGYPNNVKPAVSSFYYNPTDTPLVESRWSSVQ
ncbi:MAG: hypothetical protein HC914_09605 [Chloroflexaceae bacterium]|nr:hypothetical protein [Chloroflexaceae bacterium]